MTTLFLFAHPDDEIGVFHAIVSARARGENVVCAYLTNGAWKGVTPDRRKWESLRALARIGVGSESIHFIGDRLAIADGRLVENLDRAFADVQTLAAGLADPVSRVIMHAWEGGHQDHDAVHLIGVALARALGIDGASRQFPLYRTPSGRHWLTYAVPMAANGAVERERIPLWRRLQYLGLLRHYTSQPRVMLKLFPHVLADYVRDGTQKLQTICPRRVGERPIPGRLLYEIWGFYDFERFCAKAATFVARHVTPARVRCGEDRP